MTIDQNLAAPVSPLHMERYCGLVRMAFHVQNDILKEALSSCGIIAAMASEEDEEVVSVESAKSPLYVATFDPLDGSSNIDACIPTGTILGIYPYTGELGLQDCFFAS